MGSIKSDDTTPKEEIRSFDVDKDIIWSLVFKQSKSLSGSVVEVIQNSFDAGAKSVHLNLTETGFTIKDDGKGFKSRKEIESWFEIFGYSGRDVEENKFGRFRMGRGQIMGQAKTVWKSGEFQMSVDVKNLGLNYTLNSGLESIDGCYISGQWYDELDKDRKTCKRYEDNLSSLIEDVSKKVKYLFGIEVFINDVLVNKINTEDITYEDELFIFIETPVSHWKSVDIYNLGIYICEIKLRQLNGIVITKKHLSLNISRSEIQTSCKHFKEIKKKLKKMAPRYHKKTYEWSDFYNACDDYKRGDCELIEILEVPFFYDIHKSKQYSLKDLSRLRFCISGWSKKDRYNADLAYINGSYVVLHDDFNNTISVKGDRYKFSSAFVAITELVHGENSHDSYYLCRVLENHISIDKVSELLNLEHTELDYDTLNKNTRIKLDALNSVAGKFASYISLCLGKYDYRKFYAGISTTSEAWTDCFSKITIERSLLDSLDSGFAGASKIISVIMHEFCHNNDATDAGHDFNFYKNYHNLISMFPLYELSTMLLRAYDDALAKNKSKAPAGVKKAMKILRRNGLSKTEKTIRSIGVK
jgi:hypothetical protein